MPALMPLTLSALKTELQTDPTTLGYAPFITSGTTWKLAELLNLPRVAIRIFRSDVKTWSVVVACTVKAGYDALSAGDKCFTEILVRGGHPRR